MSNQAQKPLLAGEEFVEPNSKTDVERFRKILKNSIDRRRDAKRALPLFEIKKNGCWEKRGYRSPSGYSFISVGNRVWRSHRWVYETMVGPIPEGLSLDHLCKNKICVNPKHLEPVTLRENTLRSSINYKKTHCKWGHELSGENLYLPRTGGRRCKACWKVWETVRPPRDRSKKGNPSPKPRARRKKNG